MHSKKLVLFDYDGVIADSLGVAQKTFMELEPHLSHAEYLRRHEGNVYESIKEKDTQAAYESDWWGEYTKHVHTVEPHAGMTEVVQELAALYPLFIISSTLSYIIEDSLTTFGIRDCFEKVLGADVHTSKVVKMNSLLQEYDVTPSDCLFITDTLGDLREAAQVGIRCLAVSWGFHEIATLEKGQSEAILLSPHELTLKVQELLKADS